MATEVKPLSLWRMIIFSAPAITSAVMHGPMAGVIPALYAERFKIDLTVVGSVLLITRIFDAVIDPFIGFMTDRTRTFWGSRKPWIAIGTAMTLVSLYMVFVPSMSAGTWYFLIWQILLYLAWTLSEVPYIGWMLELSREAKTRTRLLGLRTLAYYLGGIIFAVAPAFSPWTGGKMTFDTLRVLTMGILVVVPLATIAALAIVPRGDVIEQEAPPRFRELWPSIRGNKPFLNFIAMNIFIGASGGVSGTLGFLYLNYLQIGSAFTAAQLPAILVGPLTLPLWVWLLNRYGKVPTCRLVFLVYLALLPFVFFIRPGAGALWPFIVYTIGLAGLYPLLQVAMPAMVGDIIDFDELRTGQNRAGQYSAFITMVNKATAAVGGPLALLAIGLFGYVPGGTNSAAAETGLRITYAILPALLVIPSVWLLWVYPLDNRRHGVIRRRLAQRRERLATARA